MPSGESAVLKERPKVKKRIKWKSGLLRALLYVVIILFGVTFAFPFFLTLMNSLKPLTASVGLSQIIPSEFHWENYYYAVTLIPFFKYLLNSLIIVAIVVPMCTIINMVIGYAFARLRARGKDVMFVIVLSTMMIPGIVTMIPQYILYNVLGITDTFFIYVLGNIGGGAYNIFLFKQFFSAMPGELEEAAKIDGAGTLQTIFRIFAPAAKPVIIIVAIGAFQGAWGDYMTPFMYFSPEKYPLAMALFGSVSYSMPGAPPGMVYEPLFTSPLVAMVSSFSPLARRDAVRPRDVDPYPVARYKDTVLGDALDDYILEDNVKTVTNAGAIIFVQIMEHQAVGFAPKLVEGLRTLPDRVVTKPTEGFFSTEFGLLSTPENRSREHVDAVIRYIRKTVAEKNLQPRYLDTYELV